MFNEAFPRQTNPSMFNEVDWFIYQSAIDNIMHEVENDDSKQFYIKLYESQSGGSDDDVPDFDLRDKYADYSFFLRSVFELIQDFVSIQYDAINKLAAFFEAGSGAKNFKEVVLKGAALGLAAPVLS